jgi:hypothetical protein
MGLAQKSCEICQGFISEVMRLASVRLISKSLPCNALIIYGQGYYKVGLEQEVEISLSV